MRQTTRRGVVYCCMGPNGLFDSLQVSIWSNGNEQFVLNAFIDFKLGVRFEIFSDSRFWIIPRPPRAVGKNIGWNIIDESIEHDTVAAYRGQGCIGFQLSQHMAMSVVAIQTHQYAVFPPSHGLDLRDDLGRDAGSLNH